MTDVRSGNTGVQITAGFQPIGVGADYQDVTPRLTDRLTINQAGRKQIPLVTHTLPERFGCLAARIGDEKRFHIAPFPVARLAAQAV